MSTVTHSGTENPELSSEMLAKPGSWTCVLDFVDSAFYAEDALLYVTHDQMMSDITKRLRTRKR